MLSRRALSNTLREQFSSYFCDCFKIIFYKKCRVDQKKIATLVHHIDATVQDKINCFHQNLHRIHTTKFRCSFMHAVV